MSSVVLVSIIIDVPKSDNMQVVQHLHGLIRFLAEGRFLIITMSVFLKLIYTFNAILIKILNWGWGRLYKIILKLI